MIKRGVFVCTLIFFSSLLSAAGVKEKELPKEEAPVNVVRITGIVRLTGTALFPEIIISNDENDWFVVKDEAGKLHDLQQQVVTVEAEETVIEMRFANGRSAGMRRELRNIRILSVAQ